MTDSISIADKDRPYTPSLFDRFNDWVETLPVRPWVFYVLFGIVLIVVQMLFLWLEGGLYATELYPVIIYNGLAVSFLLGLIHLFDHQATNAMHDIRPVLDTTDEEFKETVFKISNMPVVVPFGVGFLLFLIVILMELFMGQPDRYAALARLPIFNVVFFLIDKGSAFLYGVFFYHTIRQLRMVNHITSSRTIINLFNLGPLQAFSTLTATTAIGLVAGFYAWMLINPDLLSDPVILGIMTGMTFLALFVFGWPLYGVHRRMTMAKDRMLHEIDLLFEQVFSQFNQSIQDRDDPTTERLNGIIATLGIQHRRISEIPTWPWKPETARFAFTAIALPLILAVLQYILR